MDKKNPQQINVEDLKEGDDESVIPIYDRSRSHWVSFKDILFLFFIFFIFFNF